jgi:hypothetical protein
MVSDFNRWFLAEARNDSLTNFDCDGALKAHSPFEKGGQGDLLSSSNGGNDALAVAADPPDQAARLASLAASRPISPWKPPLLFAGR